MLYPLRFCLGRLVRLLLMNALWPLRLYLGRLLRLLLLLRLGFLFPLAMLVPLLVRLCLGKSRGSEKCEQ